MTIAASVALRAAVHNALAADSQLVSVLGGSKDTGRLYTVACSAEARPCGAPIVGSNMDRNVGKRLEFFSDVLNLRRGNGRQFDH